MIGQTISHYKILEKLGEGGMGVVYKAEDLTLGRPVALKFLPSGSVAREEDRARLMHEARAAAVLLHPNICPIYEIAEAQGRTFIAMAHIEGRSLKDRIAERPLPLDEALSIARQIGDALAAAHERGVIHRDIKPANIMLTTEGKPMLMDFGLAKVSGVTKLTRAGTTVGTVAYMSPEQARGEEIDQRSDVWSLGAVLYEMLAGRVPFPGDYDQAVIYKILHEEPASIFDLRHDVSPAAVRVLEGALRKDPRERYSSMRELLSDLESDDEGSVSRKLKARRPFHGHRRRVAAVLIVAIVAAGSWLLFQKPRPIRSEDLALAVIDFDDLSGSEDTLAASSLGGLLQVGLIERSPIRVVSPEYLQEIHRRLFNGSMDPIKPERATEVARKAGASLLLSGQLGGQKGSSYVIWRLIETGRGRSVGGRRVAYSDVVELADEIIAEVVPLIAKQVGIDAPAAAESVEQITSASPEALRHFTAAEAALAAGMNDDAMRELQAAVEIDSTFALAYSRISDRYCARSQFVAGREFADKAWALRARLGIKDRMMLESRRLQLDHQMAAALDVYREMMTRWPDDRAILHSYVYALLWSWRFLEGQDVAEQAIARYPEDEYLREMRESALLEQGKAAEVLASAREYRRRHPEDPNAWERVGEGHLAVGSIDSAEAAFRHALSLKPNYIGYERDLARCPFLRGDPNSTRVMMERLLARTDLSTMWRRTVLFGWASGDINEPGLVHCYSETGRLSRALALCDEWAQGVGSKDVESLLQAQSIRGGLLLDWGRPRLVLELARDVGNKTKEVAFASRTALLMRTQALVDLDSLAAAHECLAQIQAMRGRFEVIPYVQHSIAARLALAEGRPDSALAHLDRLGMASRVWDLEARGRALRALKRLPEAAAVLEGLLRINGSRFIARYQLGQIYEEMGRKADAAREYEIFLKAWENADPGWPQVEDARKRLAALRATALK